MSTATGSLEGEWEELADRVGAPPFLRAGWFSLWRQAFASDPPRTIAVRRGGELVAVAPMLERPRFLTSQTGGHSPWFRPLALDADAREEVGRRLFSQDEDLVEMKLLALEGEGGIGELEEVARAGGRLSVVREQTQSSYVDVPDSFDDYLAALSRNRRGALRRQRRRLEEQGEVGFDVYDGTVDLQSLLSQIYEIERSGWKGARGEAISSTPEIKGFYDSFARWAAERGWLRLAFLRLDGRLIAAMIVLAYDSVWYLIRGGYDEHLRSLGPGTILLAEEVAHCCRERSVRRLEMLGETDSMKASLATGVEPRHWMLAYRRTPVGLRGWSEAALRSRIGPILRRRGLR